MGILFLTVKQERCSDSLLWSAAWLLPPLRLMPMLTTATELTPTPPDTATLVSDTLPPTATATVWEPTELTELTTVKLVQLRAAEAQHNLYRQFSFNWSRTPCAVRRERILFSLIVW